MGPKRPFQPPMISIHFGSIINESYPVADKNVLDVDGGDIMWK